MLFFTFYIGFCYMSFFTFYIGLCHTLFFTFIPSLHRYLSHTILHFLLRVSSHVILRFLYRVLSHVVPHFLPRVHFSNWHHNFTFFFNVILSKHFIILFYQIIYCFFHTQFTLVGVCRWFSVGFSRKRIFGWGYYYASERSIEVN